MQKEEQESNSLYFWRFQILIDSFILIKFLSGITNESIVQAEIIGCQINL